MSGGDPLPHSNRTHHLSSREDSRSTILWDEWRAQSDTSSERDGSNSRKKQGHLEVHQIPFKRCPVEAEILKGFLLTKHIIQGYHARPRCPPNTVQGHRARLAILKGFLHIKPTVQDPKQGLHSPKASCNTFVGGILWKAIGLA